MQFNSSDYKNYTDTYKPIQFSKLERICLEMFDMLNLRNGIVITGSIGCGKSTVIQMCSNVLNKIRTLETNRIIRELREKAGKEPKQVNDPVQSEDELTEARKQLQHQGCQT